MAANPALRVNEAGLEVRRGNDHHLDALKAAGVQFDDVTTKDHGVLPRSVQMRMPR